MAEQLDAESPGASGLGESPVGAFLPATSTVGSFRPTPPESPDEKTRRGVSYWLLTLLTGVLILSFVALFVINSAGGPYVQNGRLVNGNDSLEDADRLLKLVNIVFGPVVTLVSSVVGFYFGARTAQESGRG